MLEADTETAEGLEAAEQKVRNQGHMDLRPDGVFRVADKRFGFQVLFYEPEEGFYLPALFVDIGDGPGGEVEVVGKEDVMLAGLLIAVTDPTQSGRVIGPFGPGQPDYLIGRDSQAVVDPISFDDLVAGVGLHPGDEGDALVGQGNEPREGDVGLVHGHNRALGQAYGFGGLGLVLPGL